MLLRVACERRLRGVGWGGLVMWDEIEQEIQSVILVMIGKVLGLHEEKYS